MCGPPAAAMFHDLRRHREDVVGVLHLVVEEEARVIGLVEVEHDRRRVRRRRAGHAHRELTRHVLRPVRGARLQRGLRQVDEEQEVLGRDRLPVGPLQTWLELDRVGLAAIGGLGRTGGRAEVVLGLGPRTLRTGVQRHVQVRDQRDRAGGHVLRVDDREDVGRRLPRELPLGDRAALDHRAVRRQVAEDGRPVGTRRDVRAVSVLCVRGVAAARTRAAGRHGQRRDDQERADSERSDEWVPTGHSSSAAFDELPDHREPSRAAMRHLAATSSPGPTRPQPPHILRIQPHGEADVIFD